jgi:hypothetical protein
MPQAAKSEASVYLAEPEQRSISVSVEFAANFVLSA